MTSASKITKTKAERITPGFWSVLKSPTYQTPAEWAPAQRIISSTYSSRPGRWKHKVAPYLEAVMQAVGNPDYERVFFMAASQVGKSEVMLNTLGWVIDCDPCAIMIVQPTRDDCLAWRRGRLRDTFTNTPTIREKLPKPGTKDGTDTALELQFPGGALYLANSHSAAALSAKPIKVLLLDELDRYPASTGGGTKSGEGAPLSLAEKRTETYVDRVILGVSSPSIKGSSVVEAEYLSGTQNRWHCCCLDCEHEWCWTWQDVKFTDRDPTTARLACPSCGVLHDQRAVRKMSKAGRWIATTDAPARDDTASFHLWSIHSPTTTMAKLVTKFIAALADPFKMQAFVNTELAETWEESEASLVFGENDSQLVDFTADSLPIDARIITLTVDIQNNRIESYLSAWGASEQHYGIEYAKHPGDPKKAKTWQPLYDLVTHRAFTREDGAKLKVVGVGVDIGYEQEAAVGALRQFSRKLKGRKGKAYGIRGSSNVLSPIVGNYYTTRRQKSGYKPPHYKESYFIGTNAIKDLILTRYRLDTTEGGWRWGAGFDKKYFKQFTSERRILKQTSDKKTRGVWEKPTSSSRNEALDLAVYAYAVLKIMRVKWRKGATLPKNAASDTINPGNVPVKAKKPPPSRRRRKKVNPRLEQLRRGR